VAFVVCHSIGLDTNTSSSDYIQRHSGDKATLAESLSFIQQTASSILQAIEPLGILEVRYGYSVAYLDTTVPNGESRIELLGGMVSGAPPLGNLAVRTRQGMEAAWEPGARHALGTS